MDSINQKQVSLKTKLGFVTGIVVFLTVVTLTGFFIVNSRNAALRSTKEKIRLIAESSSKSIENKVNESLLRIQQNIDYSLLLRQIQGDHREKLYEYYKNELVSNPALQGVSLVYKPGAFDNLDSQYARVPGYYTDGRLCVYWWREGNEIQRETEVVNFDEELAESGAEWWDIPLKEKRTYIAMDIYEFKGMNILMLSVYLPIISNNEYLGVMGYDFQGDFVQNEVLKIKDLLFEGNCVVNVVADDGNFAANSLSDTLIMKNFKDIYSGKSGFMNLFAENASQDYVEQNDTLYLSTKLDFSSYDKEWHINIAIPDSVIMKEVNTQLAIQLIVGLVLILISIIMIIYFISKLIKPLIDLTNATVTLSEGNLQIKIESSQNDEIGQLAGAFKTMIEKLHEIVLGILSGSSQITSGSRQISGSAQKISEGSAEQASATEQVASSIEQMITAIKQNADNAEQARLIAKKAEKGIVESQQASMLTVDFMKKIADKTSIITEIAQQTNILAINAAIEAARAGSMGKGFGIVAAEVRNLAERSHQAANEIVELSEESLKMSELSGITLSTIVPDVQKTATLVDEIATASQEQNTGVKQISMAINELNSVTLQNTATSEELASSSEELVAQAKLLEEAIAFFTIETSRGKAPEITSKKEEMKELTGFKKPVTETKKETPFKEKSTPAKGFDLNLDTKHDDEFEAF